MRLGVATGCDNIILGYTAGQYITSSKVNIAIGTCALGACTLTGEHNIAIGWKATQKRYFF